MEQEQTETRNQNHKPKEGTLVGSVLGLCLMIGCVPAFAQSESNGTGLFLEPGVSYQVTTSNFDYGSGISNSSAATRGFGVLLRGGIHVYERFFVAADARYGMLNFNDNSNNINAEATAWDIAPTIGMQMADYGARLYAGYVLAGNLDPKSANNIDIRLDDANGWRVGAGLKLQHLSVNIEWQRLHYGSSKITRPAGATLTNADYNAEGLVASVTFPMEFN